MRYPAPVPHVRGPVHDRTVEDLRAVLARSFAAIHGHVGILQKLGGAGGVQRINRHADAGAEADAVAADLKRRIQYGANPLAELQGALFYRVAGKQDGEFIAAQTRRAVQRCQQGFEFQREFTQNRVAHRMAEIVINGLEPVQIDEQAGQLASVPVRFTDLQVEDRLKTLTVEEAGQMVGNGLLAIAFFRLAQFGHVSHDAEACALLCRVAGIEGFFEDERIHDAATHAMKADGDADMRSLGRLLRRLAFLEQGTVIRVDKIGEVEAEYPGAVITRRLHPIIADCGNPIVPVEREQHGGCPVVDFRLALMGVLDLQLFLFKLGLHLVGAFRQPADLIL